MKKHYILLLLMLSSISFAQDLLSNGGFEGLSTGNLSTASTPWSTSATASPFPAISSTGSRSGTNNLLLPNDFVPFRQSFTAVAGTTYTLTLYALFTNATLPSSTDGITVSIRNNSGGNGTQFTPSKTFYITPTASAAGYIKYTYTFVAPQTDLILHVFKNARSLGTNPANTARIDDVSIIEGATSAVTVTGTPPFNFTYDGTRKSPTFSSSETITYAYSGGGISGTQALGPINVSSSYLALAKVPEGTGFAYLATSFSINQAPLTITANDATKTSSQTFTTGSGSTAFTSSGLQNGQTIGSITITSSGAPNTATVGTYPIVPSAATGGTFTASNYSITYVDGSLTVTETIGNYRSKATGNWNALATWDRWNGSAWVEPTTGEGYPGQFSPPTNVYIGDSHDVSCNVSVTGVNRVGQLEILAGTSNSSLSISSVNSLVVNGNVLIRSGGGNKTINVGSGFLSCGSISILDTGDDTVDSEITIATGGLFVFANLSMAGSSLRNAVRFTSSGNLSCGGSFTGGSLIPSTGRVTFNGSGAQSVGLYAYNNLTLSGSGIKTVPSGVTISNNLTISGTAIASLNTGTTYNVNSLTLGSLGTDQDTWGSTTSTATYKNNTYFSATTGLINTATDTRTTPAVTPIIGSYSYTGLEQGPNSATNTGTATSYTFSYEGVSGTTYGPSSTRPTDAGSYTVTATVAESMDGFYFSADSSATAFSINTVNLTINGLTADNKSYDGLTTATLSGTAAYVGLQNGESFSVTGTPSASFATANVGTGIAVTVTGYTAPSSNYTVSQPTGLTADITTASLTITANDATKIYGQTFTVGSGSTAFTSSSLQNGETIGSINIASSGAVNTASVANYSIIASAATGGTFTASNYAITYVDGTLEVTPALLTITADDSTKVYGSTQSTPVSGSTAFSSVGLQNADAIDSVTLTFSSGAIAATDIVGSTSTITPSAATGVSFTASNYTITYVDGELEVTPASLTITADDETKVYGVSQTTPVSGSTSFSSTGLQNTDAIDFVTLTYSSGAIAATDAVGSTSTITPSAAIGGSFTASNYTITYVNGTLEVTPASLTITADDATKVYGQTFTVGSGSTAFTSSSLQNGETIGSITIASSGAANTASVNTYSLVPSSATGGTFTASNYDITYVDGTLEVTPAPLTVTADDTTKVYGATQSTPVTGAITFSSVGLQNTDAIDSVTLTYSSGAIAATDSVGSTSTITPSSATGSSFTATNYDITYVDGTLEVTPASLTITADDATKCLGSTYTLGTTAFTSIGLQNSETIGSVTLTSLGDDSGALSGNYDIEVSDAIGGTFTATNYTISYVDGTIFVQTVPTEGSIGGAQSICINTAPLAFTSEEFGDGDGVVTYRWEMNTDLMTPSWSTISGAILPTYASGVLTQTTQYRRFTISTLNGVACESIPTPVIQVTVIPLPVVGTVLGSNISLCSGTNSVTLTLSGSVGNILWHYAVSEEGYYRPIWGQTSTTLVRSNFTGNSTTYFFAQVTNECSTSNYPYSNKIAVTVSKPVAGTVTGAGTVCTGSTRTLTSTSSVGTVQWQSSPDNGVTPFADIVGATGATYTTDPLTTATYYRVVVTNGICGSATSASVVVNVSSIADAGSIPEGDIVICKGSSAPLTLTGNTAGVIAWYKSVNATSITPTWTVVSGQNTTTLTSGLLSVTTWYKARVTNGSCVDETPIVMVTVNPTSVVRSIAGTGTICSGSSRLLTLGTGSVGTLQWYSSTTSATANDFSPISGATGETYLASPTATTWYVVQATSGLCAPVTSAAIVVRVDQPAAVGTITASTATLCTGAGTSITLSSAQGTIVWQRATVTNGIPGTFATISGTTTTLSTGSLTSSRAYRAVITSGVCTLKATSNVETVTVIPAAKVAAITGFNTATTKACVGTPKTLTLSTGYIGTIEWLSSPTLTGTYTVIPGETATTYVYTPSAAGVMYFKVRTTSSPCIAQAITATGVAVHADTTNCTRQAAVIASNDFEVKAYPNPTSELFTIETSAKGAINVKIYDMLGRLVENTDSTQVGSKLAAGTYNIIVNQGTKTKTLRVIKK